jgi:DNA-binding NarL/FixJ family response regulator
MPEMDGIEVLRTLDKMGKHPAIIILSSYDDIKLVKEVLQIGARGLCLRNLPANISFTQ